MRERVRVTHPGGGVSMTKQADNDRADINEVLRRHRAHGIPLPVTGKAPRYGDFSGTTDFHEAMNKVRAAEAEFLELPGSVRKHVQNDLGQFLELCADPQRINELEELGLIDERKPPNAAEAAKEPVADPPEAGAEPSSAPE